MKTIKSLQLPLIVLLANLCILFNSCNGVSGSIKNFTGYQSGSSVVLTWDYTGDYQDMIFSLYRNGERADYWSYSLDTWGEGEQICIDNSPSGGPNITYRIEYENPDGYEVFATASTVVYYDNNNSGNNDNNNNGGSNDNNNNNNHDGNNDGNNDNNQTGELDRPTGLNASAQSESVALSWNSVSGASGYYVYRSSSSSGYYDKIGTVTSTYYTDYSPLEGKNYYKVKAYNYYSSTESSYSDYVVCSFTKKEEVSKPEAPTGVSAEATSSYIKVTWNSVSGATNYKVYRSTSSYGTYSYIDKTYSTSYSDYSVSEGTTYYYKVSAENSAGESSQSSYASAKIASTVSKPSTPTGLSAKMTSAFTIELTWNSVSGAESYVVYRSTSSYGTYSKVGDTYSTSYTDMVSANTTYYYKVSAKNSAGESSQSSYVSVSVDVDLDAPTNVSAYYMSYGNKVQVTWNEPALATDYVIYRSKSRNSGYTKVGESSYGVYVDEKLPSGDEYYLYYKVKAKSSNFNAESDYSAVAETYVDKNPMD